MPDYCMALDDKDNDTEGGDDDDGGASNGGAGDDPAEGQGDSSEGGLATANTTTSSSSSTNEPNGDDYSTYSENTTSKLPCLFWSTANVPYPFLDRSLTIATHVTVYPWGQCA